METPSADPIRYPRKRLARGLMRFGLRALLPALAQVELKGLERIPRQGPLILAGNHVGVMEAVLMATYAPRQVEFLGNGDIPFDPGYAWIVQAYGFIPVNRGNPDRRAILQSVSVLKQGGILGIFPEGGVWNPNNMEAQLGVALISQRAEAPVLPIGFGGMAGALVDLLKLKRPRMVMNVGELIPAAPSGGDDLRQGLQKHAEQILQAINALIPPQDKAGWRLSEEYRLAVDMPGQMPSERQISGGEAFAHFLHAPVLLDALRRNVGLPIDVLEQAGEAANSRFREALTAVLGYLQVNPGFFTYRFGMEEGLQVQQALRSLIGWAEEGQSAGRSLRLIASARFTLQDGRSESRQSQWTIVPD